MDFAKQYPTLSAWLNTFLQDEIEAGIITIKQEKANDGKVLILNHLQEWCLELEATVYDWDETADMETTKTKRRLN
tara:strand:+ start:570 stop:797 length:228 start_codon:yes stop_codon:yes gene_type:complete